MGNNFNNNQTTYINCIIRKNGIQGHKLLEQYDNYGNIVYKIKSSSDFLSYTIYNVDEREIGSIKVKYNFTRCEIAFYDENNQIVNCIERDINCCKTRYTFYGLDKNIESVILFKPGCSQFIFEECDKYDIRTNWAEINICKDRFISEFDSNGNLKYKINQYYNSEEAIKILDSNDMEVNLSDRTLFNNGFTKIQTILILQMLLHGYPDDN